MDIKHVQSKRSDAAFVAVQTYAMEHTTRVCSHTKETDLRQEIEDACDAIEDDRNVWLFGLLQNPLFLLTQKGRLQGGCIVCMFLKKVSEKIEQDERLVWSVLIGTGTHKSSEGSCRKGPSSRAWNRYRFHKLLNLRSIVWAHPDVFRDHVMGRRRILDCTFFATTVPVGQASTRTQ